MDQEYIMDKNISNTLLNIKKPEIETDNNRNTWWYGKNTYEILQK